LPAWIENVVAHYVLVVVVVGVSASHNLWHMRNNIRVRKQGLRKRTANRGQ
jgi:hypothetical protein